VVGETVRFSLVNAGDGLGLLDRRLLLVLVLGRVAVVVLEDKVLILSASSSYF